MRTMVRIEGVNLEKLLREAPKCGVTLFSVRRVGARRIFARADTKALPALAALCASSGWAIETVRTDWITCALRFGRRRPLLPIGLALCVGLVWLSAQMVLAISIGHAGENVAEVRRVLADQGVRPGRLKAACSVDRLREELALRLPGLAFAGVRYAGSTMLIDCYPAMEAERAGIPGEGMDIVAREAGIVTAIMASSGTPQVAIGQAVRRGQVLIRGEERTEQGGTQPVRAEGDVRARVWAQGKAKAALYGRHTVETGMTRTRVTMAMPGWRRVIRDAHPFDSQDVSIRREAVVGLYLPLWREIETYAETVVTRTPRDKAEALSAAQGAAEALAKKQCPYGVLILDKTVDYSMIDNEFVYATVVLEYETSIAGRIDVH